MTTALQTEAETATRPLRILVLAPTGRDASTTADILSRTGFNSEVCADVDELCRGISEGAGLAVVTAEALSSASMRRLAQTLMAQPPWSEIPIMIFVAHPDMDRAARSFEGLGPRGLVTLVDRPIHVNTLVSATRAAVRNRLRQYDIRDMLEGQQRLLEYERSAKLRLSGLADASLAIASALSIDDVLQMITDQASRVINARFALIAIKGNDEQETRTILAKPREEGKPADTISRTALNALIANTNRTMRLSGDALRNLINDPAFIGTRTIIAAPLQEREGETIGVLLLGEKAGAEFTSDDEAVLTQLAQMASAAFQNARLYREAQDANRAKDDFLATLAHELRTPMTGILGWVQMLKTDNTLDADAATAIEMIETSTRVQARLVEDLLDVSRIVAGKLRVELAPVELAPVVEIVVETFRARADQSKVALEVSLEERPLSVFGDETRLHQVIWNLLSNAIKFTPANGRVRVELKAEGNSAVLRVSDTGRGITGEFLPHVFERFKQADNTTTRSQAGLGLGLAIVRHLVQLHGGKVNVESEGLEKGSTFIITLPILAVRVHPDELNDVAQKADMPRLDGTNVLIVDDDEEAGKLVALVLGELGAETRVVTSVASAVTTLRGFSAHVVVSDIAMPGEDGYALMHRLREIGPQNGRPIAAMALTAYGRPEDRTRILSSGFQKYVQKPVTPIDLAHAIAGLVHK